MSEMLDILIAEANGFSPEAAEILQQIGNVTLADLDRRELLEAVSLADVLWIRLRHQIDAEVMNRAARLKFILSPTTGLNHIDAEEAERRGIRIFSLRGEAKFLENVRATAELTVLLTLALLRQLSAATTHVLNGQWNRELFKGYELSGKTIGVIGYGRLGRLVARYFNAFDACILAADPKLQNGTDEVATLLPVQEVLQASDIVTLHVDLTPATRRFFGKTHFEAMKNGAYFINTARGQLVDEEALLKALTSGRITGAALDVLTGEDPSGMATHPLVAYARHHRNLLITPHLGGCTFESMEKTEVFLANRFLDNFNTGKINDETCKRYSG
jgi:D-3-phosphoglycerate dehydrogenase / 2-oxoglutarate reductase